MPATSVVVLSGKGGTAKTLWQMTMAGEASRAGMSTLLIDVDPERNLSKPLQRSAALDGPRPSLRVGGRDERRRRRR